MRVAQKFAGYSLEEADNLRKACGKKIRSLIAAEREKFVAGCERTGYGQALGTALFDLIEPFADYAFPKSHAYGYAMVGYQTAWLKANHPAEYLAALLTSVQDDKDRTAVYLAECRSQGIRVLVPDVNLSEADFTARPATTHGDEPAQPGTIVFGLAAVRNVGAGLVAHIVAERAKGGPYKDFFDFCERVDPVVLNKRTVESLVKAGAFDSLGHPRKGLLSVFEQVVDQALSRRREQAAGILSLFDGLSEHQDGTSAFDARRVPVPSIEFDKTIRLAFEKEMLGLYVSDHPLLGLEVAVRRLADCSIAGLREQSPAGAQGGREGEPTTVAGVVASLLVRYTRRGERMASFVLEDLESQIETLVFPKAMQSYGHLLEEDAIVCVKGRLDNRDDQPKLVCMELSRPELSTESLGVEPLRVQLSPGALSDQRLVDLKALLLAHPGPSPVLLCVGDRVLKLPPQFSVEPRAGLLGELRELLGAGVAVS